MATATKERKKSKADGITFDLQEFSNAVRIASIAVPARAARPSLTNLLIGDGLITGSDSEFQIDVEVAGAKCTPMLLPKDRLCKILANAVGNKVTLTPSAESCEIAIGRGTWTLPMADAAEFPRMETDRLHTMITLPGEQLRRAAKSVIYAIDRESSRYALGGVFIECVGEKATFVATDGRRLSLCGVNRDAATDDFVRDPKGTEKKAPIVPTKPLWCIANQAADNDSVVIECSQRFFKGTAGGVTVTASLIGGEFPKWHGIVPKDLPAPTMVRRETLLQAVSAAAVVATQESKGVVFTFTKGCLTLEAKSAEAGNSSVEIEIESVAHETSVKLDPAFVNSFLKPFGTNDEPEVAFHVCGHDKKTVLKVGDSCTGVIMPLAAD
jgi:DNA polymerase-3 subunit beta